MTDDEVEEAQELRRSHCSRQDRSHECVGTVTISRDAVNLSCRLCGVDCKENQRLVPAAAVDRAKAVVEAAGLRWESLSEDAQRKASEEIVLPWVG